MHGRTLFLLAFAAALADVLCRADEARACHVEYVLKQVGGNKRRAARELGVARATLERKLREIEASAERPPKRGGRSGA